MKISEINIFIKISKYVLVIYKHYKLSVFIFVTFILFIDLLYNFEKMYERNF